MFWSLPVYPRWVLNILSLKLVSFVIIILSINGITFTCLNFSDYMEFSTFYKYYPLYFYLSLVSSIGLTVFFLILSPFRIIKTVVILTDPFNFKYNLNGNYLFRPLKVMYIVSFFFYLIRTIYICYNLYYLDIYNLFFVNMADYWFSSKFELDVSTSPSSADSGDGVSGLQAARYLLGNFDCSGFLNYSPLEYSENPGPLVYSEDPNIIKSLNTSKALHYAHTRGLVIAIMEG